MCFMQNSDQKDFQNADNDCKSQASPYDGYLAKVDNVKVYYFILGEWSRQE